MSAMLRSARDSNRGLIEAYRARKTVFIAQRCERRLNDYGLQQFNIVPPLRVRSVPRRRPQPVWLLLPRLQRVAVQQYDPHRIDEWRHATPHAALTDASPKGRFCFVPAALLPVNGRMWAQNWHPGMHVNDSNGQSGPALNGIEYINPNGVALARRGVRNVTRRSR